MLWTYYTYPLLRPNKFFPILLKYLNVNYFDKLTSVLQNKPVFKVFNVDRSEIIIMKNQFHIKLLPKHLINNNIINFQNIFFLSILWIRYSDLSVKIKIIIKIQIC